MIKKTIFTLALACSLLSNSMMNAIGVPDEFFVKQRWFAWTSTFDIETKSLKLGTVNRKLFSWSLYQYDFYNVDEELQASAKMRWMAWDITFDITDADEQSLGRVERKFTWFYPTYQMISPKNVIQAEASLNFWCTTYTVSDPTTQTVIATMHRNFFRLKDDWTVTIHDQQLFEENEIDPRFFIVVMAFQSDLEAMRRFHNSNSMNNPQVHVQPGKDTTMKDQMIALYNQLEKYRYVVERNEPSDEDVEAVDRIVSEIMDQKNHCTEKCASPITYLKRGFKILLPMFESDELSPSQKSALFLMMEQFLNGN